MCFPSNMGHDNPGKVLPGIEGQALRAETQLESDSGRASRGRPHTRHASLITPNAKGPFTCISPTRSCLDLLSRKKETLHPQELRAADCPSPTHAKLPHFEGPASPPNSVGVTLLPPPLLFSKKQALPPCCRDFPGVGRGSHSLNCNFSAIPQ